MRRPQASALQSISEGYVLLSSILRRAVTGTRYQEANWIVFAALKADVEVCQWADPLPEDVQERRWYCGACWGKDHKRLFTRAPCRHKKELAGCLPSIYLLLRETYARDPVHGKKLALMLLDKPQVT